MANIAIIGASSKRNKFANKAVRAFVEHGDTVFPIHPVEQVVEGLPAFSSVKDVPQPIDVASFYVPASAGLHIIEEVAEKGIPRVLLNPGAESPELLRRAAELGIKAEQVCSIRMIGRSPSEFSEK